MELYVLGKPKIHHWGAVRMELNFEHCRGKQGWFCLCPDRPDLVTFYCQCGAESPAMEVKHIISCATLVFIGQTPQIVQEIGGVTVVMKASNNLHAVGAEEFFAPL